jgi:hypothetical protein
MRAEFDAVSCKSPMSSPVTVRTVSRLQHDHRGTDRHAIIEVDYVLVDEPDAAARHRRADSIISCAVFGMVGPLSVGFAPRAKVADFDVISMAYQE